MFLNLQAIWIWFLKASLSKWWINWMDEASDVVLFGLTSSVNALLIQALSEF